jgi:hypothetical protein
MVYTPFGPVAYADVHCVPSGSEVFNNGTIALENGTIEQATIENPNTSGQYSNEPSTGGWVEDANYYYATISEFTGSWTVPSPPSADDNQLIYLFIGTEDFSTTDIIQPVLQWGNNGYFGGPYWTMASWFVGAWTAYSTPINVNAGDSLSGLIQRTFQGQGGCEFKITSSDSNTGGSTTLNTECDQQYYAFTTLEEYRVIQSTDYPSSGATIFNVFLYGGGNLLNTNWGTYVNTGINPQCGFSVLVMNQELVMLAY